MQPSKQPEQQLHSSPHLSDEHGELLQIQVNYDPEEEQYTLWKNLTIAGRRQMIRCKQSSSLTGIVEGFNELVDKASAQGFKVGGDEKISADTLYSALQSK